MNWRNASLSRGTGIISSLNKFSKSLSFGFFGGNTPFGSIYELLNEVFWVNVDFPLRFYCYDEWCYVSQSPYAHKIHSQKGGFLSHGISSSVSGKRLKKNNVYLHTLVLGTSSPIRKLLAKIPIKRKHITFFHLQLQDVHCW